MNRSARDIDGGVRGGSVDRDDVDVKCDIDIASAAPRQRCDTPLQA